MMRRSHALFLVLVLGAGVCCAAQSSAPTLVSAAPAGIGEVEVKDTRVAEVDASHLKIAVDMVVKPSQTATLEDLRITGLRMNGLPLYADALNQPIDLVKGKQIALPSMYVSVLFRDLTTVAPLREMVDRQTVHIQGEVVAAVHMTFLQKLVLHTEHPHVSVHLAEDVPVTIGSSPFERAAALGLLALVDSGLQGGVAASKSLPALQEAWVRDLEAGAHEHLLLVETSYLLKQQETSYPVIFDQIGFRLASGAVIATAEATAPWEFDAEFQARIKAGEVKLEKSAFEMRLSPAGKAAPDDAALLLTHKDFTVSERGSLEKDAVIVQQGGMTRIDLRKRASPTALAVLQLHTPAGAPGYAPAPEGILQQDSWDKVAVFRLTVEPNTGKQQVGVVTLAAHRDGRQIRFDRPVDGSMFGSPILAPDGLLGLVQDEDTGAFLPDDLVAAARKAANP